MPEDRIVEDRTVIVETERRGSGSTWIIAVVLIAALVIGILLFSRMAGGEAAKDNAIANAADNVGAAAKDVGDAAKGVTDGK